MNSDALLNNQALQGHNADKIEMCEGKPEVISDDAG
jgi:hypothetical protein